MPKFKFTAKKWNGDDSCSWAVFCNDRVMPDLTGLNREQARYYVNMLKLVKDSDTEWAKRMTESQQGRN